MKFFQKVFGMSLMCTELVNNWHTMVNLSLLKSTYPHHSSLFTMVSNVILSVSTTEVWVVSIRPIWTIRCKFFIDMEFKMRNSIRSRMEWESESANVLCSLKKALRACLDKKIGEMSREWLWEKWNSSSLFFKRSKWGDRKCWEC